MTEEVITSLGFSRRNFQWTKTPTIKNRDAIVALVVRMMLNDIYPADQLLDFQLRARDQDLQPTIAAQPLVEPDYENHEMNTEEHPILDEPPISKGVL